MRHIPLGKTGIKVSALCLGCMNFGTRTDEKTSIRLLDQYVDAGGSFLDTANNYAFWNEGGNGGESETLLGRWMKERKNRDQIILATKVGANPTVPGGGLAHKEGLSAEAVEKAIDESLARLGTDYIDLYYAHIDDRETPLEETLQAFDRLVKAGKVRAIGCSNYRTWRIEAARNISRANGWASYCCVQQRYTYLRPKPGADFSVQIRVNDELLDYYKTHDDFALLAYSPLLGGAYTRRGVPLPEPYAGPDSDARMDVLAEVCEETKATPNQVVLAWLNASTPIPVIAASTPEQLRENLDSLRVRLSDEQIRKLNTAGD